MLGFAGGSPRINGVPAPPSHPDKRADPCPTMGLGSAANFRGARAVKVSDSIRKLSVMVVSRRRLFADSLARNLATDPRVHVLGVHLTINSMLAEPRSPDLALTFGGVGDGSAAEVLRVARRLWPHATIVTATESDRPDEILPLLQAGADGYVTQSSTLDELLGMIDRARHGEQILPATVVQEITAWLDAAARVPSHPAKIERLTPRELEILRSLTEGLRPLAIAQRDATSRATVRHHVQNILRKLGAHSILEAVAFGIRHQIVDAPSLGTFEGEPGRAR
jgi:two-component system nitrate/nitrite response regulator NarL